MTTIARFRLDDDTTIYAEVADPGPADSEVADTAAPVAGVQRVGRGRVLDAGRFDEHLAAVLPAAHRVRDAVATLAPDSADIEFGIILSADIGHAILARAGGEAHFKVILSWKRLGASEGPTAQPER